MAARRAQQARAASHLASSSNLATAAASPTVRTNNAARLKATSMTNLQASGTHQATSTTNSLKRPASRNALDSIHKGMNAKFTHVQSKVLLQNIRPQGGTTTGNVSKIPANSNRSTSPAARSGGTLQRLAPATPSTLRRTGGGANTPTAAAAGKTGSVQSDRSQLINRIKALQEELAERESEREDLKRELERERADRTEQVAAAKGELEAKALEAERQSEEYHQKLIEAYELADQNRRAADNVLSESRQREEELRKKIEELESQLSELREFVTMKEEMMGKMGELREQIRVERERYEEKTRSLHQMFENEKIRRQKPSLQSVESINRLTGGGGGGGGETILAASCSNGGGGENEEHQKQHNKSRKQQQHHQSEHDIYGSKLSTRMQDGARAAWKKSRKFASSVITGSLGGLSACRKHNISGKQRGPVDGGELQQQQQPPPRTMLHVNALPQERQHFGPCPVTMAGDESGSEQHTSVVEVGATVGEFISTHTQQQQVVTQAPISISQQEQQATVLSDDDRQQQQESIRGAIRVDENNKLTIVTKFNELAVEPHAAVGATATGSHCAPSAAHSEQGSERSRCESSSSGRGTSDCGSPAGSQNGDQHSASGDDQQQQQHHGDHFHHSQKTHERKSSLFKPSGVFGGESTGDQQTGGSMNKTLKSFFAHAANSTATAKAQQQHPQQRQGQDNDGEITTTTTTMPPRANEQFAVRYEGQQHQPHQGEDGGHLPNDRTENDRPSVLAVESH